jgi:hypothetical protein
MTTRRKGVHTGERELHPFAILNQSLGDAQAITVIEGTQVQSLAEAVQKFTRVQSSNDSGSTQKIVYLSSR